MVFKFFNKRKLAKIKKRLIALEREIDILQSRMIRKLKEAYPNVRTFAEALEMLDSDAHNENISITKAEQILELVEITKAAERFSLELIELKKEADRLS